IRSSQMGTSPLILLIFLPLLSSFEIPLRDTSVGPHVNPNHVSYNEKRKHIDVDSSWLDKKQKEVQKVSLDASNAERVLIQLLNTGKELSASAKGNIAVAEGPDGQRAQVQKIGEKGGIATAGKHKAQLRTSEAGNERHAFLKADGQYDLDTVAKGSLKNLEDTVFEAHNDKYDFGLDPHSQNNDSGTGDISYFDKEKKKKADYAYTIKKSGGKTEATLESGGKNGAVGDFAESLFGRRSDKYHCTAETPGVSQCYDGQGKSVGKVVADKNGNTVVYNDKDVPIGTGTVKKTGPRSYEAVISKNLFVTRLKDYRSAPCCKETTGKNCTAPIKLANPSFDSPSNRDGDGTVHLTWPSCFDMGIDVTLPPGVHIERLAMKLDVSIQPIGKLRCMDVATCGRECFYCDWCKESRKLKLLDNTDGNLCRATGQRTYRLTVRLCPPPEDPEFTMCSAFSKSVWQKDYWQKEGAVDIWMKFFERAETRPEKEKEFFAQIDNPLLGKAFKLAIIAEWLAANSLDQGSYTPTNSELLEYFVSKRAPDTLLACQHTVIDYELEGAKVQTNVLFEAATTAGNFPNILKDKKCAAFENLQENRFQSEAREYKAKGGGGLFGGFSSFLNSAQEAVRGG
ncbi:tag-297, partial [Pristionchus pacificus]